MLAHERILQFLLAEMAAADASLTDRLLATFSPQGRRAHQHDYTDAEDYAEAFMRQVLKLNEERAVLRPNTDETPSQTMSPPHDAEERQVPVIVEPRSGVWQVRRSAGHLGDYLDRTAAVEAALNAAIAEIRSGAKVTLIVEGVPVPIGDKGAVIGPNQGAAS